MRGLIRGRVGASWRGSQCACSGDGPRSRWSVRVARVQWRCKWCPSADARKHGRPDQFEHAAREHRRAPATDEEPQKHERYTGRLESTTRDGRHRSLSQQVQRDLAPMRSNPVLPDGRRESRGSVVLGRASTRRARGESRACGSHASRPCLRKRHMRPILSRRQGGRGHRFSTARLIKQQLRRLAAAEQRAGRAVMAGGWTKEARDHPRHASQRLQLPRFGAGACVRHGTRCVPGLLCIGPKPGTRQTRPRDRHPRRAAGAMSAK